MSNGTIPQRGKSRKCELHIKVGCVKSRLSFRKQTKKRFGSYNRIIFSEFRRGSCKWFNVAKGWGFVTPDDGSQEVFVHQVS